MKRRRLLTLLGAGGLMASAAALTLVNASAENALVKLIRAQLHFLKLDEQGLRDFARAHVSAVPPKYRLRIKGFAWLGIDAARSGQVGHLVQLYLLSSDYFLNGSDDSRTVRFVRMYNPYTGPCVHPFSSYFYPQPLT